MSLNNKACYTYVVMKTKQYSAYFQAVIPPSASWFITGALRSCEYMAFDRTLDVRGHIYEFFVPYCLAEEFVALMSEFQQQGLVVNLKQLPNRLIDQDVHDDRVSRACDSISPSTRNRS